MLSCISVQSAKAVGILYFKKQNFYIKKQFKLFHQPKFNSATSVYVYAVEQMCGIFDFT